MSSDGAAPRGASGSPSSAPEAVRSDRETFPRSERLRAHREFQALFRRGARVERPSFVLLWERAPGPRRVGMAVSRRLGGSVERNRARRRLREAYRRGRGLLSPTGIRLLFVARPRALREPFPALVAEVAEGLRQVARRHALP